MKTKKDLSKLKVAIVHDFLTQIGGAEKILESLVELFPRADIYMLVYNPKLAQTFLPGKIIRSSFLQKLPFMPNKFKMYLALMPRATESINLKGYDLVFSITSAFVKGVITTSPTVHICYLNTPTRYLWEISDFYIKTNFRSISRWFITPILKWIVFPFLKKWDLKASQRPDIIIANSINIDKKTKQYYHRASDAVIYPFVDDKFFVKPAKPKDFYLLAGRLVPYKRFDIVIEAFNKLQLPLKVIGTGYDEKRLQSLNRNPKTKFLGRVSDDELIGYYQNCRAYIFPADEDFGITPIEAMATGRPVVALGKGGALETVINGKTGIFFNKQDPQSVVEAVDKINENRFDTALIQRHALKFSKKRFILELKDIINKSL